MKPSEIRAAGGRAVPVAAPAAPAAAPAAAPRASVAAAPVAAAAAARPSVSEVKGAPAPLLRPASASVATAGGAGPAKGAEAGGRGRSLSIDSYNELWNATFIDREAVPAAQALLKVLTSETGFATAKFGKMLQFVIQTILAGNLEEKTRGLIASDAELSTVFNGLYDIFVSALRVKAKENRLGKELESLGFPGPYTSAIVSEYIKQREALEAAAVSERVALPALTHLNWRVDVTISTTTLSRVFKPSITLSMTLSDGRIRTFECSEKKFQELRYNVAKVYKGMMDVESHPTIIRAE